jgi:hypothetical protein
MFSMLTRNGKRLIARVTVQAAAIVDQWQHIDLDDLSLREGTL